MKILALRPGMQREIRLERCWRAGVVTVARAGLMVFLFLPGAASRAGAAEVIPPAPTRYFNDYAGVTSAVTQDTLNRRLEEFEKSDSSQVVVAVFPRMASNSSIEDYVHRMFTAWRIGQKGKNNGVLLAVFVQDRRLRIEVGYGLEGALPDALARRIIDYEIAPHFKQGSYDAGLGAGVGAILAAVRGEYRGTGQTVATGRPDGAVGWIFGLIFNRYFPWNIFIPLLVLQLLVTMGRLRRWGTQFDRRGRRRYARGGWNWHWGSGSFGGGGGSGGGWSGGGGGFSGGGFSGGGFSGGGGSSGGGGASGSW